MVRFRRSWTVWGLLLATVAFCGGCDFFAFSQKQLVKKRCKEWAKAVADGNWNAVSSHYAKGFLWQRMGGRKLRGAAAAKGFKASILAVADRDNFFIEVKSVEEKSKTKMVANVVCQIHIIVDPQQMVFSNLFWRSRIFWQKEGTGTWKMTGLQETTKRGKEKK